MKTCGDNDLVRNCYFWATNHAIVYDLLEYYCHIYVIRSSKVIVNAKLVELRQSYLCFLLFFFILQ